MKIFSICLTKNEHDIIGRAIECASHWSDLLIVIDHGSSDGTETIIRELSKNNDNIVSIDASGLKYHNGLRSLAFNKYKHLASPGKDWWCIVDSDEFYIDDPRLFLSKIPRFYRSVYSASFQYYFTFRDALEFKEAPEKYLDGNCIESLHYFKNDHSELRCFRHYNYDWPKSEKRPDKWLLSPIYPNRIRLKHFQYRHPEQIQERLSSRIYNSDGGFSHERRNNWDLRFYSRTKPTYSDYRSDDHPEIDWRSRLVDEKLLLDDRIEPAFQINPDGMHPLPPMRKQIVRSIRSRFNKNSK